MSAANVKKIKPYPFGGDIELNAQKKPVELIFLTVQGFLANLKGGFVSVGEYYQINFELPVLHRHVLCKVRVIKTYDRSRDAKEKVVDRMAEFHFESLTEEHKKSILSFLAAIGQK